MAVVIVTIGLDDIIYHRRMLLLSRPNPIFPLDNIFLPPPPPACSCSSSSLSVIEISPFLRCTGPALFHWTHDKQVTTIVAVVVVVVVVVVA